MRILGAMKENEIQIVGINFCCRQVFFFGKSNVEEQLDLFLNGEQKIMNESVMSTLVIL